MVLENNETKLGDRSNASSVFKHWVWAVFLLIAGALVALSLVFLTQGKAPPVTAPMLLTGFEGSEKEPALSPDGERVAFCWDGGTGGPPQLHVLELNSKEPTALTRGLKGARSPSWSPKGRHIVFLRPGKGGDSDVVIVPAVGGKEKILTTVVADTVFVGIDWSPDAEFLALVDTAEPDGAESIFLFNLRARSRRRLTTPHTSGSGDRSPAFSNSGRYLAFARWWEGERNEIYVVDLEDEHQRLVARFEGQIRGLDWLPDDSALVFTARWKESLGLWRLGVERGELTRLDFGQNAFGVTTSRNSNRLVFSQLRHDCNIWRVSGPGAKETSPPTRFIATTAEDRDGRYSPDGSKVAFVSTRLRENQIWVCLSDGTNCKQLTPIGANAVEPWWSPSGDAIAFTEMSQGNCEVYTIDVNAGIPFRLTRDDSTDVAGSWSGDGQWVYFISDRTGQYEIWRTTVLGKNTEQLTFNGGNLPIVSPDDQFIYYMKLTAPTSIWRLSLESHIEELICEADIGVGGFNLWNNLVIYILQDSIEGPRIESFDVETRRTHIVADLGENTRLGCYRRHSLSPDGQWMLFTRDDGSGADLVLVDAFQ